MSIITAYSNYVLVCDVCGEQAPDTFPDFYDAVNYKKDEGWRSSKKSGEWRDICPDCAHTK